MESRSTPRYLATRRTKSLAILSRCLLVVPLVLAVAISCSSDEPVAQGGTAEPCRHDDESVLDLTPHGWQVGDRRAIEAVKTQSGMPDFRLTHRGDIEVLSAEPDQFIMRFVVRASELEGVPAGFDDDVTRALRRAPIDVPFDYLLDGSGRFLGLADASRTASLVKGRLPEVFSGAGIVSPTMKDVITNRAGIESFLEDVLEPVRVLHTFQGTDLAIGVSTSVDTKLADVFELEPLPATGVLTALERDEHGCARIELDISPDPDALRTGLVSVFEPVWGPFEQMSDDRRASIESSEVGAVVVASVDEGTGWAREVVLTQWYAVTAPREDVITRVVDRGPDVGE